MNTTTRIMIARTPIIYEDIRESEAEVRFLISEESPLLLTCSSFILIFIDSFTSWVAYSQTQVHNVPIIVKFDMLSPVIEIADDDVVVSFVILV